MSSMTGNEFKQLRAGDITPAEIKHDKQQAKLQDAIDAMSTKDYLIARTQETIQVPITGLGGSKNIDVRARLSKAEMKQHKTILDRWNQAQSSDEEFIHNEEDEHDLAVFLTHITIDDSLSSAFWLSNDLDPNIANMILTAYFISEPTRQMVEMQKFLSERLRTGIQPDVAGVAPDAGRIR